MLYGSIAPLVSAVARGASLAQIRLAVVTDEIDNDLEKAIAFLKEFGLGYAEIRNLWGQYNTSLPVEKVREARTMLDAGGLKTAILGTALFKVPLMPETPEGNAALDEQWKLLDAAIERAGVMGTDKIRVFGFTRKNAAAGADPYPRIYELLGEAARRAKAKGFRLAMENIGGSFIGTGAQAAEALKHVREDSFGLIWDPNNAAEEGEKPFPEGFRLLDPARIFHVHLRDYRRGADGKVEWCAVGDGEFDNVGQIRALIKAGYKETYSLETHWKSPRGKEYASRTSLTGLLKVVAKV